MKSREAGKSFEIKVEIVERSVRDKKLDPGVPKLTSIRAFVQWSGEHQGRKYGSWSSQTVAAPNGPNADLRKRLDAVLPAFQSLQRIKIQGATKKPPRGVGWDAWLLAAERDNLLVQNTQLIIDLQTAKESFAVLDAKIESLKAQNAMVTKEYTSVVPFRRVDDDRSS